MGHSKSFFFSIQDWRDLTLHTDIKMCINFRKNIQEIEEKRERKRMMESMNDRKKETEVKKEDEEGGGGR